MLTFAAIVGKFVLFCAASALVDSYVQALTITLFFKVPRKDTFWRLAVANTAVTIVYSSLFRLVDTYFRDSGRAFLFLLLGLLISLPILKVVAYFYALKGVLAPPLRVGQFSQHAKGIVLCIVTSFVFGIVYFVFGILFQHAAWRLLLPYFAGS